MIYRFIFGFVGWGCLVLQTNYTWAERRPNVLILLSDDHGYADLGVQGSQDIPTPFIDSIANNGIRCTSGYVSSCMCSPSRAGLLTGRSQSRFGHEINWEGRDNSGSRGLPVSEKTLADHLAAAGYRTGVVGKWHLGDVEKFHPKQRGFHQYFGHIGGSHDYLKAKGTKGPGPALEGWDGQPFEFEEGYLTEVNATAACEFIDANKSHPWFLYVAFNAPHGPLQATRKYLERFPGIRDEKRRTYAAMVSALDDAVGKILDKLNREGIGDDTLVFFLSDNGGPLDRNGSLNTPLNGEKGYMFEGGIRVPFLVQWKSVLPRGKTFDHPVSSLDVCPTALAAAGAQPIAGSAALDGVDLIPFFSGRNSAPPHEALYWRMKDRNTWAIRMGDWKLVANNRWHDLPAGIPKPRLIHLATDIGELKDLSAEHPEKLVELQKTYDAWNRTLIEPLWESDKSPEAVAQRQARLLKQKENGSQKSP